MGSLADALRRQSARFLTFDRRITECWAQLGAAVRTAQALGLHRDPSKMVSDREGRRPVNVSQGTLYSRGWTLLRPSIDAGFGETRRCYLISQFVLTSFFQGVPVRYLILRCLKAADPSTSDITQIQPSHYF